MWGYTNRTLTTSLNLDPSLTNHIMGLKNYDDSSIPSRVWSYNTRTTTNNLTAAQVWSYIDRTITAPVNLASNVENHILNLTSITPSQVWSHSDRTLTEDVISPVLESHLLELHNYDDSTLPSKIWKYTTRTTTNNLTAAQVWSYATVS